MRRLERLIAIGLSILTIGVAAPVLAQTSSPSPSPQPPRAVKKQATQKPAPRWDKRLRGLDVNGDAMVTFAEWDADEESFDARDWDDDGILSGDELIEGAVCPAIPARTSGGPDEGDFERLDANHDDRLSRRELGGTAKAFSQLDFNRDGRISPFEFGVGR